MNNAENQVFPLGERNISNEGAPVLKKLPSDVSEYEHSVPRQALGTGGRRYTYCTNCSGWVAGPPHLQTKATPFAKTVDNETNIYRCRRCGQPLDTRVAGGAEQKNKSGIGGEGQLRP
jgi:hypothetical protein